MGGGEGSVKEKGGEVEMARPLNLPASDEQSVLYLGHQLKVEAML